MHTEHDESASSSHDSGQHGHTEHAHGGHGHAGHVASGNGGNLGALIITMIAALLSITEISGKGAQTEALVANVDTADLWAFYQSKSIRQTVLKTNADTLEDILPMFPPDSAARLQKRIGDWREAIQHFESDEKSGEGKKELMDRAREMQAERERCLSKYRAMEMASAAYELAIVFCSVSLMLKRPLLLRAGIGIGLLGLAMTLIGWIHPALLPPM